MFHATTLSFLFTVFCIAYAAPVSYNSRASEEISLDVLAQNAKEALELNNRFATLNADDACAREGGEACISGAFAKCVEGTWVTTPCIGELTCFAMPSLTQPGTSVTCTTQSNLVSTLQIVKDTLVASTPDSEDVDNAEEGVEGPADVNNSDDCEDQQGNDDIVGTEGTSDTQSPEPGSPDSPQSTELPSQTAPAAATATVTITVAPSSTVTIPPVTTTITGDILSIISSLEQEGATIVTVDSASVTPVNGQAAAPSVAASGTTLLLTAASAAPTA